MIVKHPYGVSPTLTCTINGAAVAYDTIYEVELYLEADLHDMAILHLVSLPVRASQDYRGKGVQVILDNGGSYVHEFVGYVTDVRPVSSTKDGTTNNTPFQDAKIVCMGTSYPMRGAKSRVWTDVRLAEVAMEFASLYGFSVDVPSDPLIMTPLVQDMESDWKFLVRYARMMGYCVTLHGTHLHIFDPFKAASRATSYHKLRTSKNLSSTIAPHPGNIIKFDASLSERHPDGVYKDTIATVFQSDEAGTTFDVSLREMRGLSNPAQFSDRISAKAYSYAQAARAIEARSKEQYDFHATVEVLGLAGCKPGGVVNVEEYGSEVDGLWYVQGVTHRLNSAMFTTELALRRNIRSELDTMYSVAAFKAPPEPRLLGGAWSASKRSFNAYS